MTEWARNRLVAPMPGRLGLEASGSVKKDGMPLFDFHCRSCGADFEMLVLRSTIVVCRSCSGSDLEQLLSSFAVSSQGIRDANALGARKRAITSSENREKKAAEAEYIADFTKDHGGS